MKRIVLGVLLVALGAFLLFQSYDRARAPITCGPNFMEPDGPRCVVDSIAGVQESYAELETRRNRIALAYLAGGGVALIIGGGLGVSGFNLMGVHILRRRGENEVTAVKE
jgi:hypothetical protein